MPSEKIVRESQKQSPVVEVSHRELRSRDVKPAVTHSSHEEQVKHSTPQQVQSPHDEKETTGELIPKSPIQKAEESTAPSEKTPEKEVRCKTPASPLEPVITCLKEKETSTSKEEITVAEAGQTVMERNKPESPVPAVTSEHLKRKLSSEQETELSTEKKPRVTQTEAPPPATAKETVEQRVPPLKVCFIMFISKP